MTTTTCPAGHSVPADAPEGFCLTCVAASMLNAEPEGEEELEAHPERQEELEVDPKRVAEFEIVRRLGRGGFGLVYLARKGEQEVALKVLRDGAFADVRARRDVRAEARTLEELRHPGIVAIHDHGEHLGLPFFTMEYMPGKTLRERMNQRRMPPREAAAFMIGIAEIVEFLHGDPQRPSRKPVLHCDLKPENILFDAAGKPRVADFGIARHANEQLSWSLPSTRVGTVEYMAPEQADSNAKLHAGTDVYSLGAILYELFTGRPPFVGTPAEVLHQLKFGEPVAPRRLAKGLDRFLETVVLNALEKNPDRRYRTARAFAQDLKRALALEPPEGVPPVSAPVRVRDWVGKNPLATAAIAWALALSLVLASAALRTFSELTAELDAQQERTSVMASIQAVAMKLQLREYRRRVALLAEDPAVEGLLASARVEAPSAVLLQRRQGFDGMFVLAPDGRQRARTTEQSDSYLERTFAFRDYFRGARALALSACAPHSAPEGAREPEAYVARAYKSEGNGLFEFAVSAPVCDARGWIGVVVGTVRADTALGSVRLADQRKAYVTALLGPRDNDRADGSRPLPSGYTFVAHPGLGPGQLVELRRPAPDWMRAQLGIPNGSPELRYGTPLRVDDYYDPVFSSGPWAATFSPVYDSGYVVVVQSLRRNESAISRLLDKLTVPAGIPFSAALLLLTGLKLRQWFEHRRRERARRA
ncbi:MAG TPA: serine/threonine protein kinase [Polyangiaceae bacterium]